MRENKNANNVTSPSKSIGHKSSVNNQLHNNQSKNDTLSPSRVKHNNENAEKVYDRDIHSKNELQHAVMQNTVEQSDYQHFKLNFELLMKSFEKLRGYKTQSRDQLFEFWRQQKNSVFK